MKFYICSDGETILTVLADSLNRAACIAASKLGCRCLEVVAYEKS